MFGKIHTDIFNSSLIAEGGWLPTYIFMCMVTLSDKDGILPVDPRVLYRQIGLDTGDGEPVTFEAFLEAIEFLSSEDRGSNLTAHSGRRIIPLSEVDDHDGNRGFCVVNKAHYRDKGSIEERREKDAKRKRRQRAKEKAQARGQDEGEIERDDPPTPNPEPKPKDKPNRFAEFWKAYPGDRRTNRDECEQVWTSKNLDENADKIIADVKSRRKNDPQWKQEGERFIPGALKYLESERWEDSPGKPREAICLVHLRCDFDPHAWLAPEVLAKISDREKAEYEYIKARNLESGYEEPDFDSPEERAKTERLLERLDGESAEAMTADNRGKPLRELMGFQTEETS